ncbi:MAG TPA: glutathione S-transferase N-terminal domain-containing protein [Solirubrobacteraceae bacterium]|nr:glutathione S-transferase N-terminal domain-containing protein [Solirubrobacteraceae bacterium]
MAATTPTLYSLTGSHPCAAVEEAMRRKGIDYRRVELLPLSQLLVGPVLYGAATVPGMRIGAERIAGSRSIMRRLDTLAPEPPLLPPPADPRRESVLDAERWGDDVLQGVPRRLLDVAFVRRPAAMESYAADGLLHIPPALLRPALPFTARMMALRNKATDESARTDLMDLPYHLDRVDGWITEGLLGGEQPNAADLQIGSSIRLLMTIGDVRPLIEGRPSAGLVGYFPPMAGEVPAGVLPAEWQPASVSS